jgi:hypothetical protein
VTVIGAVVVAVAVAAQQQQKQQLCRTRYLHNKERGLMNSAWNLKVFSMFLPLCKAYSSQFLIHINSHNTHFLTTEAVRFDKSKLNVTRTVLYIQKFISKYSVDYMTPKQTINYHSLIGRHF